jgi:sodium/proline symporter
MALFNLEYYGVTSVIFNTGIYEFFPGFIISLIAGVVVSLLTKAPDEKVVEVFEKVKVDNE